MPLVSRLYSGLAADGGRRPCRLGPAAALPHTTQSAGPAPEQYVTVTGTGTTSQSQAPAPLHSHRYRHHFTVTGTGTTSQSQVPAPLHSHRYRHHFTVTGTGTTSQSQVPAPLHSHRHRHHFTVTGTGTTSQSQVPAPLHSHRYRHHFTVTGTGTTSQSQAPAPLHSHRHLGTAGAAVSACDALYDVCLLNRVKKTQLPTSATCSHTTYLKIAEGISREYLLTYRGDIFTNHFGTSFVALRAMVCEIIRMKYHTYPATHIPTYMTEIGFSSIVRLRLRAFGAQPPSELMIACMA